MLTNNQIEPVQASELNSHARVKHSVDIFQPRLDRSATVGVFLAWILQAMLGAEFLLALAATLRFTHTISRPAMLADGVFLILASALCYMVATGQWKIELSRLPRRNFMAALILAGVFLRIIWVMVMPPVQLSDAKDYLTLSRTLLSTGSYVDYETGHRLLAFRAPGYPAFLALFMRLLGDTPWMPAIGNLLLFVACALVIGWAADALGGKRSAFIALLLFVLWPCDIFVTGLAISEPLTLFLFTTALWLFTLCDLQGAKASVAAGIVGGAAALTRPTFILLPLLWALFVVAGQNFPRRLRHLIIASVVMAATVAPWTIRNYRVLHAFVTVSSNGGDVFYRANNNLATGTYTPAAEENLDALQDESEVKWSAESYAHGKAWIRSHPVRFLKLAVVKAFVFTRDDETGIYWSMARAYHNTGPAYAAFELLSDTWWQFICLLGLFAIWRRGLLPNSAAILFAGGYAFLMVVHLVYESQSRYRMPAVGLLIVIIGATLGAASSAAPMPAEHRGTGRTP